MDSLTTTSPLDTIGNLQEAQGIFIGDTVIRHALLIGLQDLRNHPWQLEIVFRSLLDDPYTINTYGAKEISKAINWFLSVNVPVIWDVNLQSAPSLPCITIGMQDSNEVEATLGDVHYLPSESTQATWEPVGSKFTADYDPTTGLVTPSAEVVMNTQMVFVDGAGNSYPILSVNEDNTAFYIQTGLVTNFSNCVLKWSTSKLSVQLESLSFKETYTIGSHAQGEGYYLLYLDAITLYCLLRYKKTLLEGRGFERTTIARTKVMKSALAPEGTENVWCRFINLSGFVRNYWAVQPSERIVSAGFATPVDPEGLRVSAVGHAPTTFIGDGDDPPWMASDGIGARIES